MDVLSNILIKKNGLMSLRSGTGLSSWICSCGCCGVTWQKVSGWKIWERKNTTHFASVNPNSVTLNFGSSGFVAYSLDNHDPPVPRLFAVVDDIFCLFQGHIENLPFLKQQYGLNKITNEAR